MVVLNLSPEPNIGRNMLKFESPKGGGGGSLREKKLTPDKQFKNCRLKKKKFSSFLSPDKKETVASLPVPTVPPYPIEFFEKKPTLCHTNRAFECTEEYLIAHNLVPEKDYNKSETLSDQEKSSKQQKTKVNSHSYENVIKVQPNPTKDFVEKQSRSVVASNLAQNAVVKHHRRTSNIRTMPLSIHDSFKYPSYLKYFNTVGIPVFNSSPNQKLTFTGSFKYPSETSRLSVVPMPSFDYGKKYGTEIHKSLPSRLHYKGSTLRPLTNGTLKSKMRSMNGKENHLTGSIRTRKNHPNFHTVSSDSDSRTTKVIPSVQSISSDSDSFPHGGPPPYPGLRTSMNITTSHTHPSHISNTVNSTGKHRPAVSEHHVHRTKLFPFPPQESTLMLHRHYFPKSSPIKVYADSKEILISSLSPPPRLPVKVLENVVNINKNEQKNHETLKQNTPIVQKIIPVYSKVNKPKKPKNSSNKNRSREASRETSNTQKNSQVDQDLSTNSGQKENLVPSLPTQNSGKEPKENNLTIKESRSPSYEDIVDFQEDEDRNTQKEFNVEVRIDYSKGNRYKMWTKHTTTLGKKNDRVQRISSSSLVTEQTCQGKQDVSSLSAKIREISELKNFKLGLIRVISIGKWRFVALCCCGNTKRYIHQPGRIENYIPGFSSLSEKELRDNPEADVKLEIKTKESAPVTSSHRFGSSRMQMSNALKDTGYESDSTLVFRKREDQRRKFLDPKNSSVIYKQVQLGGEIPLTGLQKPAPPRPKDDFYIVYSDLDIGLSHPDLYDIDTCSSSSDMPSSTSRYSPSTFGEKKRTAPSKANAVPSPPRRLSSKWHPSLIKSQRPPPPVPRSTSAERVRDTRALYSSWHREMVAKSRERLSSPPSRSPSNLEIKKKKDIDDTRKNFLLDRRAVSESRFTLHDKKVQENTKSKSFRSTSAEGQDTKSKVFRSPSAEGQDVNRSKIIRSTSEERRDKDSVVVKRSVSQDIREAVVRDVSSTKGKDSFQRCYNTKEKPPLSSNRQFSSLERPPKISVGKLPQGSRSAGTSPARSVDTQKWSTLREGRGGVAKHTVSSLSKIKSQQSFLANVKPRSHSADEGGKTIRHANCLAPKSVAALPPKKSSNTKREMTFHCDRASSKNIEIKRNLEPSESFDTTHSNETGYCSMLDLSTSPISDQRYSSVITHKRKDGRYDASIMSIISDSSSTEKLSSTLPRRYEPRAHSAPGLRTRSSAFFFERLEKWQALTKEDSVDRPVSRTSTRSNSPLRSLELVKKVSSSFKNIPKEINATEVPITRSMSLEALCPSPHSHPRLYREYILELKNAVMKSARISQLRQLFDSLEKIHKLERSVSTAELTTCEKRKYDIIDFDTWKTLRDNEKKALEYHILVKQLDDAKKEREFLYNVGPNRKWSGDCRLRGREKYVSELKDTFDTFAKDPSYSSSRREQYESENDTYKGLWRGSSVKDLSKTIGGANKKIYSKRGTSLSLTREDSAFKPKGLWTSLSLEQINALREQLTEIYGSMQSIRSWRQKRDKLRESGSLPRQENTETVRTGDTSSSFKEAGKAIMDSIANFQNRPVLVNTLETSIPQRSKDVLSTKSTNKLEEQRKRLSKQLSIELQEKVAEQRSQQDKNFHSPTDRPCSVSPDSLSRSSPRTCYSLDISDSSEPTSLTSNLGDQFLLVVRKPKRSNSLPNDQNSDGESSDSDASIKTVIHKDVAGKVKFFEKKARRSSRSSERQSLRGSYLSIDPSEVPHYATLPLRHKKNHHKNDIFNSDYLPVRSASSITLNRNPSVSELHSKAYPRRTSPNMNGNYDKENSLDTSYSRSYLLHVKTGDVCKLRERYEQAEARRKRSKSLPDMGNSLSYRITPTDRTFIRGQEMGDVKYTRAKYEMPRTLPSTERWQPPRNEYLPKSKIANTLYSLGSRSAYFNEPQTIERISRRDSVEKSPLKRIHTGVVEQVVDKFESGKSENVSLVGEMFTSAPSIPELIRLSPLVPPRPPLPNIAPQKPLRSSSYSPRRLPKIPSPSRPIKTSTPFTSPQYHLQQRLDRSLSCNYPRTERQLSPSGQLRHLPAASTPYDAAAHIPKFRYTPADSYGASKWTQSLERPSRLVKVMSDKRECLPKRTQSFSPPPRGLSSLKYSASRSISPPQQPYSFGYGKNLIPPFPKRYSHAFYPPQPPPIPSPPHYYPSQSSLSKSPYRETSPQNRYSYASAGSSHSGRARMRSPPRYSSPKETLERAQNAFKEMKDIISTYIPPPNKVTQAISKYERPSSYMSDNYYNTYPLRGGPSSKHGFEPQVQKPRLSSGGYYGTVPPRITNLYRDTSSKSVTFKEPVIGTIPYPPYQRHYGEPSYPESPYKYNSSEVNIHYRTPVRVEQKESLSEEELARRQEEHMKKVYENERRKKYLAELEDIERRRHTDNFTPLQKSPIPLNRYDDETFGGPIGAKTPEPKQVARALFNFSAQNKRELSFNKGDIVTIRRCIDRNWYEGEVRGVVGIFPCNYVEVVPFDSLKTLGRRASEGQARTRFNFQAQTAMEMSLTKGEMVILTRRVDENWYEGRVGNRRGIFPVTYVDVMAEPGSDRPISPSRDPMPRPALPAAHLLYNGTSGVSSPYSTMGHSLNHEHKAFTQLTVNTQQDSVPYRALYNYKPQNEDELELIEGDIVLVMEKCDDGWFVGTSKRTGLFGTFPGNYVERC